MGGGFAGRGAGGAAALAACLWLVPAGASPRVFADAAACESAQRFSADQCAHAYANARAEFYEKAPRFASRAQCLRYFSRCMIADIGAGGRVAFTPALRGFVIDDGARRQTTPVAEGGASEGLFAPRPIDRRSDAISAAETQKAKIAWSQRTAPASAAPVASVVPTVDPPPTDGPMKTYPVSKAMLRDMQTRANQYGGGKDAQ